MGLFLVSGFGMLVGIVVFFGIRRWGRSEYKVLNETEVSVRRACQVEMAEELLFKYGLRFEVLPYAGDLGGLCDFRRKRILLTYPRGIPVFGAFFEAAHEVGHAVNGRPLLRSGLVAWLLVLAMLAAAVGGAAGWPWPLAPGVALVAVMLAVRWRDEVEASRFAVRELRGLVEPEALLHRRLTLDKWYVGLESLALGVMLVSAFVFCYAGGRWLACAFRLYG